MKSFKSNSKITKLKFQKRRNKTFKRPVNKKKSLSFFCVVSVISIVWKKKILKNLFFPKKKLKINFFSKVKWVTHLYSYMYIYGMEQHKNKIKENLWN